MKKVYRIQHATTFQELCLDLPQTERQELSNRCFYSKKKMEPISSWFPELKVYVRQPFLAAPDFFNAPMAGEFSVNQRVYDDHVMRSILEAAGELLSVEITDANEHAYIFNMLHTSEKKGLVDLSRCEVKYGRITKIAFHNELLPDGGLFRVPEAPVDVYAVHDPDIPLEMDFVQRYCQQGYKGLDIIEADKAYM